MLIYKNDETVEVEETYQAGTEISFNCIASISGERTTWKIICEDGNWIGRAHDCGEFLSFTSLRIVIEWNFRQVTMSGCTTRRWRTVRASSKTPTHTSPASTTT